MKIDRIYQNLPKTIQNVGLTLYGYQQKKIRYMSVLPKPYDDIENISYLSRDQVQVLQENRLRELLAHAGKHVPFYRACLEEKRVSIEEVSINNFREIFPVLTKETIISDPALFISERLTSKPVKLFTSGTSGTPLTVYCTKESRAINYKFYRRILAQHHCGIFDKSVTLAGRLVVSPNEIKNFCRTDYVNRTMYCSSYHLKKENYPIYISEIERWNPTFIDSYPSAISQISEFILSQGIKHKIRPKVILTSAETISESQRCKIEEAFSCPVVDQYGCTEMAVLAHSLSGGDYHTEPLYSLVELDHNEDPEYASLICTGLLNFAMPLIRYRIGDVVRVPNSQNANQLNHVSFSEVIGREDDLIITPEGHRIGRMDPAFKGIHGVKKVQIIQIELNKLEVLVVKDSAYDFRNMKAMLVHAIKERTSPKMIIDIKFVDSIALTKAGKFKAVISNIRSN